MWARPSPKSTANLRHSIVLVNWRESCWNCCYQNCEHNWLAEEFPISHPGARFLVFRDRAQGAQTFEHESISLETIRSTARELLSECERLQPDVIFQQPKDSSGNAHFTNFRPLIFICRGLGGLVVKEVYDTTDILISSAAEHEVTLGITSGRKTEWERLHCSSNMRDCMASISGDNSCTEPNLTRKCRYS